MAQTAPDATFIVHVQLAIIGVILVVGLFYIWRIVTRIEDKVDILQSMSHTQSKQCSMGAGQCQKPTSPPPQTQSGSGLVNNAEPMHMDECDATDALMKSVFGDVFMMSAMGGAGLSQPSGVQVTEITDEDEDEDDEEDDYVEEEEKEGDDEHGRNADDDTPSVVADSSKLSKNKLKNMGVNMLKELCSQRNLSTDGVKSELIQRIIDSN